MFYARPFAKFYPSKFWLYSNYPTFIENRLHEQSFVEVWNVSVIKDFSRRISFMNFEAETFNHLCLTWFMEVRIISQLNEFNCSL